MNTQESFENTNQTEGGKNEKNSFSGEEILNEAY